jgi:nucleoside-diphosphate-sugar epimerase
MVLVHAPKNYFMKKAKKAVLVAGAQGVIGRTAAEHFSKEADATIYGVSRRPVVGLENVQPISVDLMNSEDTRKKLGVLKDVTHVVFGAYVEKETPTERSVANVALLRNLMDTVEELAPNLRHVTIYQGGKAYGADLGPFKTPAREDDPRLMPPNFYYDQEDHLRQRQQGKRWTFSVLRPEAVCGYAVGNPMNLLMVIAVYAAISKELGLPLRFPGTEAAYRALYQITSADILARATAWAGETEEAKNEIFNITNGDYFRWQFMWPRIARMFEMHVAEPVPMPLAVYMADKGELWAEMTRKYRLQSTPYEQVAAWRFGDFIFGTGFDNITSTIKARRAGFHACIDTEDMFSNLFNDLRQKRVIPQLS